MTMSRTHPLLSHSFQNPCFVHASAVSMALLKAPYVVWMVGICRVIGQVFASGNAFVVVASENLTVNNELSIGNKGLAVQKNTRSGIFSPLESTKKKNYISSVINVKIFTDMLRVWHFDVGAVSMICFPNVLALISYWFPFLRYWVLIYFKTITRNCIMLLRKFDNKNKCVIGTTCTSYHYSSKTVITVLLSCTRKKIRSTLLASISVTVRWNDVLGQAKE